jgi:hypothetical protein
MKESLIRFFVGGLVVSFFAVAGDLFKPKSFAGLFGAAPSVALATLTLTIARDGKQYAATEASSMMVGAIAFFAYASCLSWALMHRKSGALQMASLLLPIWVATAFGLWYVLLR